MVNGDFLDVSHIVDLKMKVNALKQAVSEVRGAGMMGKAQKAEAALDKCVEVLEMSFEVHQRTAAELEAANQKLVHFAHHGRLD